MHQVVDPTYGNLAFRMSFSEGNQESGNLSNMTSVPSQFADVADPRVHDWPLNHYLEYTFRSNVEATPPLDPNCINNNNCGLAIAGPFEWTACINSAQCAGGPFEIDPFELGSSQTNHSIYYGDMGFRDWSQSTWSGGTNWRVNWFAPGVGLGPQPFTMQQYHKVGLLVTTDSVSDVQVCSFVDDVPIPTSLNGDNVGVCHPYTMHFAPTANFDGSSSVAARQILFWWLGSWPYFNYLPAGSCPAADGSYITQCMDLNAFGPVYNWIKSIKVFSCADNKRGSSGPNPHCYGESAITTGPHGETFHKITTQ
jgi:hypothetical protein